jgi:hypothetical protein
MQRSGYSVVESGAGLVLAFGGQDQLEDWGDEDVGRAADWAAWRAGLAGEGFGDERLESGGTAGRGRSDRDGCNSKSFGVLSCC